MLICPSCYTESPDNANFCLHCGTSLKSQPNSEKEIIAGNDSLESTETMTQALRRLMPTSLNLVDVIAPAPPAAVSLTSL